MKKMVSLIFVLFYSIIVGAKNFPPPPKDNPCHPVLGCNGVPIDGDIIYVLVLGLILGAYMMYKKHTANIVKD